jgi:hypothetical protein
MFCDWFWFWLSCFVLIMLSFYSRESLSDYSFLAHLVLQNTQKYVEGTQPFHDISQTDSV